MPEARGASGVIKCGWLLKRSVTAPEPFKNWRRRWIVLKANVISWHHGPDDAAAGALTFGESASVVAEQRGRRLCLRLTSANGVLVLAAPLVEERDAWRDAVAQARGGFTEGGKVSAHSAPHFWRRACWRGRSTSIATCSTT